MCGIAGIVHLDEQIVATQQLEAMNAAIRHRGPDDDGIFSRGGVGLVHRRLAIIDPQAGIQPFFNDDRSIALTYNGELYNFVEVRKKLEADYDFRTNSDTEVLVRAYEKWGIDCLEQFQGMFAFALYDARKQLIYLVRDRVGIKPLYYYRSRSSVMFASELSALLRLSSIPREINPAAVANYLRYQYVPTPLTIYQNIYKLEPGHFLKIDVNKGILEQQQYWQLSINPEQHSEDEWLEMLNAELDDVLRIYVRSDVPFGAFLSGGVDSSLVTALMSKQLQQPVQTFSIGFQEKQYSELPYAAAASQVVGSDHHERVVTEQMAFELLQRIAVHFGEPFGDSSAIPTYHVAAHAAQNVKMVLSGDGGDELFAGYKIYPISYRDYASPRPALMSELARRVAPHLPSGKMQRFMAFQGMTTREKFDYKRQIFGETEVHELLTPRVDITNPAAFESSWNGSTIEPVTRLQARDFKTYLVDAVLTKVDRMSMANSLEVRVPLLDHKIVELAFNMPLSMKLRPSGRWYGVETKYLLKRSAERFYDRQFLARGKRGFGIPISEWCQGQLREPIEESLRDPQNSMFDWLDYKRTQKTLDSFFSGRDPRAGKVWLLLMFDLWIRHVHTAR